MCICRFFLRLTLLLLLFTSCNRHSAVTGTVSDSSPAVVKPVPDNSTIEDIPIPSETETTRPAQPIVAYIRKTACFGRCPVFEAVVKSDGIVEWNGKQYVDRLGKYRAKVSSGWIDKLTRKAQEQGYFSFASRYPANGSEIADIPHTIFTIQRGSLRHTVDNGGDAPAKLIEFETFFIAQLETLRWEKM
jgi:hypothetical protein